VVQPLPAWVVADAWFDSGAMPYAQWHYPEENHEPFDSAFPADFICEAIDQTRGWFYSLLWISTLLFEQQPLPFGECIEHSQHLESRLLGFQPHRRPVPGRFDRKDRCRRQLCLCSVSAAGMLGRLPPHHGQQPRGDCRPILFESLQVSDQRQHHFRGDVFGQVRVPHQRVGPPPHHGQIAIVEHPPSGGVFRTSPM